MLKVGAGSSVFQERELRTLCAPRTKSFCSGRVISVSGTMGKMNDHRVSFYHFAFFHRGWLAQLFVFSKQKTKTKNIVLGIASLSFVSYCYYLFTVMFYQIVEAFFTPQKPPTCYTCYVREQPSSVQTKILGLFRSEAEGVWV